MRRLAPALIAVLLVAVTGAVPALAHSSSVSTSPEDGATLEVLPDRVSVTLDERPMDVGHAMAVTAPDGTIVSTGQPKVTGHQLSIAVRPGGPAGAYTVGYRVVSADGHPLTGSFDFTVTSGRPVPGAVKQIHTAEDENSVTAVFAVFSVVLMAAFIVIATLLIRRRHPKS